MYDFKLPDLGEGIHEAQIVRVLVKEGDRVAEFQPLLEVETDKAAVEIPSPKTGTVSRLHIAAGQTVKVGEVLISFDDGAADAHRAAPAKKAEHAVQGPQPAPAAKRDAAPAAQSAPVEVPTQEPEELADAKPRRAHEVQHNVEARRDTGERPAPPAPPEPRGRGEEPVPAAPAVRRLARELEVDIDQVSGTGPAGRILREDVEAFARGERPQRAEVALPVEESEAPSEFPQPHDELPDFSKYGPIRREAVPQIRKTIARQMARSWANIPRVTQSDDADITDLEENRKSYNATLKPGETKLTMTAIMLKLLGAALKRHPRVNASYDPQRTEIIFKEYVHIGLAVDTPRGLVVPVIRDVDIQPLQSLAAELANLSERTRNAQFDIAELRGASFTITNYGALGGTVGTPMINFPEAAILGMGRAKLRPWVHGGQIVPRLIMPLSLSFDHRIVDGADAARFLNDVIAALENPLKLLSL